MTVSAIFKSTIPSCTYVFKNGQTAVFISGKCLISDQSLIDELAAEVGEIGITKSKHPHIYVDENEQEVDSEALSPLEIIKLKAKEEARQELLAEQAAAQARALNATANTSESSIDPKSFVASLANTTNIAQAGEADSNSVDTSSAAAGTTMGAKLADLSASLKAK
jgi:hypothetical protein